MNWLKKLFGGGPKTDFNELISKGGIVLDVRTQAEFRQGHIRGALNIPVQDLYGSLSKLKKDLPIITCCASGMRSASARGILRARGFAEVYNGGAWTSLERRLSKEKSAAASK